LRRYRHPPTQAHPRFGPQPDAADQLAFAELQRHVALTSRVAWAWRCGCLTAGLGVIALLVWVFA
jgi:hypothetical protein